MHGRDREDDKQKTSNMCPAGWSRVCYPFERCLHRPLPTICTQSNGKRSLRRPNSDHHHRRHHRGTIAANKPSVMNTAKTLAELKLLPAMSRRTFGAVLRSLVV